MDEQGERGGQRLAWTDHLAETHPGEQDGLLRGPTWKGWSLRADHDDLTALKRAVRSVTGPATARGRLADPRRLRRRGGRFVLPVAVGAHPDDRSAWALTHALRALPGVLAAEPLFELALGPAEATAHPDAPPAPTDPEWALDRLQVRAAWPLSRGAGIRIAHPDSGYRAHPQLWTAESPNPRIDTAAEKSFFAFDRRVENHQGDHGLGTASVMVSPREDGPTAARVTGVAPEATLIPLRVTKPHAVAPAPVLLWSGTERLVSAIDYAVRSARAHVLSVSLGWIGTGELHRAVRRAYEADVIVIAAAGNYLPFFVAWPAAYPEVVGVAGSTAGDGPWPWSGVGPAVDVAAPASGVWRAVIDPEGRPTVRPGDGTSFSTALVSGLCALWLAHHGRAALIAAHTAPGEGVQLTDVFLSALSRTCTPLRHPLLPSPPLIEAGAEGPLKGFGAGLPDARRLLTTPIPPRSTLVAEASARRAAHPSSMMETLNPAARTLVLEALGLDPSGEAIRAEPGLDEELVFLLLTRPALRHALLATLPGAPPAAVPPAPSSSPAAGALDRLRAGLTSAVAEAGSPALRAALRSQV
jgi:hypothetical protein